MQATQVSDDLRATRSLETAKIGRTLSGTGPSTLSGTGPHRRPPRPRS